VRSDFESTLRELLARRDEGSVPAFARVVVETTGLADPAPLVQAVETHPLLSHFCRLGAVLATIDAMHATPQLASQWEARKQVALADRLLLTKTDLAGPPAPALLALLQSLNPHAELTVLQGVDELAALLEPVAASTAIDRINAAWPSRPIGPLHGDVQTLVLRAEAPLDWLRLQQWLERLHALHGERLLRLKGIVRVAGEADALVLHGVHHLAHPPLRLPGLRWPAAASALVLIARGPAVKALAAGFDDCIAAPAASTPA
jgi:G3E family GTPase